MSSSYTRHTQTAKISNSKEERQQRFPESERSSSNLNSGKKTDDPNSRSKHRLGNNHAPSPFEVVIPGEALIKEQKSRQQTNNIRNDKGIFYRTLDSFSNNPYFVCGSIQNVADEEEGLNSQTSNNNRYRNLLRCGIGEGEEDGDDIIDYELDEKDLQDILLRIHTATSNISSSNYSSKSRTSPKKNKTVTKKGRIKVKTSPKRRTHSLYRKTMMTAAEANEATAADSSATPTAQTTAFPTQGASPDAVFSKTARFARGFADDAGRAIGNLLPTASLQNITARKYTLPDKTVASQVLMYRQLLHTKCRPGLKLSRPYQETPAQKAVMHMPWWEHGIEESKKMVISYDNLVTRLWLNGAIEPFQTEAGNDLLTMQDESVETFITDEGLPPIPHQFWVDRLGFQQPDPVTDFRSGGVLSLAMMVYMVESKPNICQRFFTGDTKVLPFGITCINVTDMIAKFLMLAKSTDRMDALLSQKPFWKMFADPNAITAVQELAMSMLCDVACELGQEKKIPALNSSDGMVAARTEVTVFDFSTILERTERRVRDDLLGAGPKTVDELRSIEGRLRIKYKAQLERKIQRAKERQEDHALAVDTSQQAPPPMASPSPQFKEAVGTVTNFAGGLFARVKGHLNQKEENPRVTPSAATTTSATIVDLPPTTPEAVPDFATAPPPVSGNSAASSDGDWTGTDIADATEGITNFSIGDDEDEADLLGL